MAALLVGLSVMSVLLAAAMPVWSHAQRREREEELIWRGEQYRRAIMLFQRKYANTFPPNLDILVDQKFLRRKYKDPITDEDFQIIPVGSAIPGVSGGLPGAGGAGQQGRPGVGGTNSGFGTSSSFGSQTGGSGFGTQGGFGAQAGAGMQGGFGTPQGGFGGGTGSQGGFGSQPAGGFGTQGSVGGGTAGTQPAMGIQGVTSKSKDQSIRRYNNMDHYNQWAFVAMAASTQAGFGAQQFGRPGMGTGPGGAGGFGRPGVGQQPGGFGQQPGGFGQPGGGFGRPGGTGQPGGGFGQPGSRPPVPGGFGSPSQPGGASSPFRPAGPGFGQQQPRP